MKLSLECKVESMIIIHKTIEIENEEKLYVFYPNKEGFLSKLKIISPVSYPEKFYSTITPTPNSKSVAHFDIKEDEELMDSIRKEFQELESDLSFTSGGSLKKIHWDNLKSELICETEEEKKKANIIGVKVEKNKYPVPIIKMDESTLRSIVTSKADYTPLIIPKAFFREGLNDFHSFRYINAFYNFYFILEGLYGNGKSKNKAVEWEFKKSKDFCEFVEWSINNIKNSPRHLNKITQMLKQRNKSLNVEGIIHLLAKTRGALHHFVNIPHKIQGTPFNHKEFESIAWITMGLAARAIPQKILEINQQIFDIDFWIDRAIQYKNNYYYASAIECCEVAIKKDSNCNMAWELLGEIYNAQGRNQEAHDCFKKISNNNS